MTSPPPIPFLALPGAGPWLHLAHANAYPPGTYRQLLSILADAFQVLALVQRPLWPGSDPKTVGIWSQLPADLIRFADEQGWRQAIGVGHSLGAVVTLMAARARPDLFRALILIEPVFLPPSVLALAATPAGRALIQDHPIVRRARTRRQHWPSRRDAFADFREKRAFKRLSDTALWDYVNHGLVDRDGGVALAFSRAWETRIYDQVPLDIWEQIPAIGHPTLALRGAGSEVLSPDAWRAWQEAQPVATFVEIQAAGHLLPLEKPVVVAEAIRNFVAGLS